jgi:hypothetical protein
MQSRTPITNFDHFHPRNGLEPFSSPLRHTTMTQLPGQSRQPLPAPLAMSTAVGPPSRAPTPSPVPARPADRTPPSKESPARTAQATFLVPSPKLRFELRDLTHPGALVFLTTTNVATVLADAVTAVLHTLYPHLDRHPGVVVPPVRSVTLVLRAMAGVAYTTGTELDPDHKEIHLSLDYIRRIPESPAARQPDEIRGVLVHEMVHVWQWDGRGTAPGGLIEGVADFVRLRAGLGPPHWKRGGGGDWDAGYEHTGYFLDWLETRFGEGSVVRINERLRAGRYVQEEFWKDLFGESVEGLWAEYNKSLESGATPAEEATGSTADGLTPAVEEAMGSTAGDAEETAKSEAADMTAKPRATTTT